MSAGVALAAPAPESVGEPESVGVGVGASGCASVCVCVTVSVIAPLSLLLLFPSPPFELGFAPASEGLDDGVAGVSDGVEAAAGESDGVEAAAGVSDGVEAAAGEDGESDGAAGEDGAEPLSFPLPEPVSAGGLAAGAEGVLRQQALQTRQSLHWAYSRSRCQTEMVMQEWEQDQLDSGRVCLRLASPCRLLGCYCPRRLLTVWAQQERDQQEWDQNQSSVSEL